MGGAVTFTMLARLSTLCSTQQIPQSSSMLHCCRLRCISRSILWEAAAGCRGDAVFAGEAGARKAAVTLFGC